MKTIQIILFLLFSYNSFADEYVPRKSIERNSYSILSNVYSEDVPEGKCLVIGVIKNYDTPVENGLISTLDRERYVMSNDSGEYKLLLDVGDTSIFCFKENLEEVVVWSFPFESQHVVIINFYPTISYDMIEVDKPVIYLYNDEPLTVDLELGFKGELEFTYPKYDNGWSVEINEENRIVENGVEYPYLFWEGTSKSLDYSVDNGQIEGFVVEKDNVTSFLEKSLSTLGLTFKERADFITFWAPKMVKSPFVFVQFIIDDEYSEKIASISVSPEPDSKRRVYMLYSPLEKAETEIKVSPQELQDFERKGFTMVEWGGSMISKNDLIF